VNDPATPSHALAADQIHSGYKCNIPSAQDFGANVVSLPGSFQQGTKLFIQLPGKSSPRVWKVWLG
jgi:hypothetical protein